MRKHQISKIFKYVFWVQHYLLMTYNMKLGTSPISNIFSQMILNLNSKCGTNFKISSTFEMIFKTGIISNDKNIIFQTFNELFAGILLNIVVFRVFIFFGGNYL